MKRSLLLALLLAGSSLAQPAGYNFVEYQGKLVRHPVSDFPWKLYLPDQRRDDGVLHAIRSWNAMGQEIGIPELFTPVSQRIEADTVLDYSGEGLPRDKAAGIWWSFESDGAYVTRFVVDPGYKVPNGNRAQVLLQEMGHMLGLDHSNTAGDIMFPVAERRKRYKTTDAKLSSRDKEAFRWLYSQERYLPIISSARSRPVSGTEQPAGPTAGTSSGVLVFDPIKVEITASVNVRLTFRNPGEEILRAPLLVELWGRVKGDTAWRPLKSWGGLDKVPAQFKVSRDYFSELQPLFQGRFELLARVSRADTKEILAERVYP